MIQPRPKTTTHTVEMNQISELNECLAIGTSTVITAAELGLEGASLISGLASGGLPSAARIVRVSWDGPPEYPYLHGHFASDTGKHGSLLVDLHTEALRTLSHRLSLRHSWGWGSG